MKKTYLYYCPRINELIELSSLSESKLIIGWRITGIYYFIGEL